MKTLQEMLCDLQNEGIKGIVFAHADKEDEFYPYSQLYCSSMKLLGGLQAMGVSQGDHVIMQVKKNEDTVLLLWACLLGGIIAVPLTYAHTDDSFLKLKNVSDVLKDAYIVGDAAIQSSMVAKGYFSGGEKLIGYDQIPTSKTGQLGKGVGLDDTAVIQFSSGTTGIPKGVLLSNKNIATNVEAISIAAKINRIPGVEDSGASWLPLTNDLGLVGFHLSGVYHMENIVMIDPMSFFFDPTILFEKIQKYRATITINPNFALEYLLGYFSRQKDKAGKYDLSSLRLNICGSEPIKPQVAHLFDETFSAFGLRKNTLLSVYGLAEACLAVSFSSAGEPYTVVSLDRKSLSLGDKVVATDDVAQAATFVSVGTAVPGTAISIRDRENTQVPDGTVGIVYIKGDSLTCGYINNEEATNGLFSADGWLNTFDIGVVLHGELYIIGRQKDMIIIHGRNYYCGDLEKIISHSIRREVAIVNVFNVETKNDDIYVFVLDETEDGDIEGIKQAVKTAMTKHIGATVKDVFLVKSFPRTEGGKVRRFLLKQTIRQEEGRGV